MIYSVLKKSSLRLAQQNTVGNSELYKAWNKVYF